MTTQDRRSSRRAFIAASAAGAAVTIAQTLRPTAALAADGDTVVLGQDHAADSTTTIRNTTTDSPVLIVRTNGAGTPIAGISGGSGTSGVYGEALGFDAAGVKGASNEGFGVAGSSTGGNGVFGSSMADSGVRGESASGTKAAIHARARGGAAGVAGITGDSASTSTVDVPLDTGVFGYASGKSLRGAAAAVGVHGKVSGGTGVLAEAGPTGTALRVNGKARFSNSGIVRISAGKQSVTKSVGGLTSSSIVFAVVRSGPADVWVRKVSVGTGQFVVLLNKTATTATDISWIAVN